MSLTSSFCCTRPSTDRSARSRMPTGKFKLRHYQKSPAMRARSRSKACRSRTNGRSWSGPRPRKTGRVSPRSSPMSPRRRARDRQGTAGSTSRLPARIEDVRATLAEQIAAADLAAMIRLRTR